LIETGSRVSVAAGYVLGAALMMAPLFVTKHWIPKPKPPREIFTVDMRGEPFAA
jgi:hypothetical protein